MASPASERTPLRAGTSSLFGDTALRVRLMTVVFSLAEGYDIGVIANALGPIQEDFGLTPVELGIFASSLWWAATLSSAFTGSIIDFLGRKVGLAVSAGVLFAGNLCWTLAPNFIVSLTGRIIVGLGLGIGVATIAVYMAEVAPVHKRGFYVSMEGLFIEIGIVSGFAAGAFLVGMRHDWRYMVGIGMVLPLISFIAALTPCLPESPRWLQGNGRADEAREVLLDLLHGDESEVNLAFAKWEEEARSSKQGKDFASVVSCFFGSHSRVALAGIGTGIFFLGTGVTVLVAYSVELLSNNGMSPQIAGFAMACIGGMKICFLALTTFVIMDRVGRRPLLILSAAIVSGACAFIGYGMYSKLGGTWIAVGFGIFQAGFAVGLGAASFAYMSEVFDNRTRGIGVSMGLTAARLVAATWVLIFPVMAASFGWATCFFLLAGIAACGVVFFWLCCPETSGVALEEVNALFQVKEVEKI